MRNRTAQNVKQVAYSFIGTVIRLVILAVALYAIYKAGLKAYDFGYRIFTEEPMSQAPGREVAVTIVQGDSLMDVCNLLEEKGLVRDAKLTFIQKKVSVYNADVKPGFYTLTTAMTADEMFELIAGIEGEEEEESEDSAESEPSEIDITPAEPAPLTEEGSVDIESPLDKVLEEDEGFEGGEGADMDDEPVEEQTEEQTEEVSE